MSNTKEKIFRGVDIGDVFQGYNVKDFESVERKIIGYDEGNVSRQIIVKHIPSKRFFKLNTYENSWCDSDSEDYSTDDIKEVFPKEKTIIVYEE